MRESYVHEHNYLENQRIFGDYALYQIGRRILAQDEWVEEHSHRDFIEITVVDLGEGDVFTNGTPTRVRSGDIYVSFAGDFHAIHAVGPEPMHYDCIAFSTKHEHMLFEIEWMIATFHEPSLRVIRDGAIPSLIASVFTELAGEEAYRDTVLCAIFTQLLCRLLRAFRRVGSAKPAIGGGDERELCYEVMNYIDTHIYHIHSLGEVAQVLNYSYNYLSNLFRRVTGETLLDYYRRRRLKTARLLLCEADASVSKVASLLGYSSLYTFSRAFKQMYGVSPSKSCKLLCEADDEDRRAARLALLRADEAIRDATDVARYQSK